jgi:hypothetical protein
LPEYGRVTSIFRPEECLWSRRLFELGASDRATAVFWADGGVVSEEGGSVHQLSFSLGVDRSHAHNGGTVSNGPSAMGSRQP